MQTSYGPVEVRRGTIVARSSGKGKPLSGRMVVDLWLSWACEVLGLSLVKGLFGCGSGVQCGVVFWAWRLPGASN